MALHFNIGAKVHCEDGVCGNLVRVVVNPETARAEELVVESGGAQKKRHVVPVDLVERTTDEAIRLSVSMEALRGHPEYEEYEVERLAPGWNQAEEYRRRSQHWFWPAYYGYVGTTSTVPTVRQRVHEGVSPEMASIGRGTPVRSQSETIGTVDHLLVDRESGEVNHVVVRHGLIPDYPVIPENRIKAVTEEGVVVTVTEAELEDLPQYTPRKDEDIAEDLERRFTVESGGFNLDEVQAGVDSGVVRLTGKVMDEQAMRYAESLVLATEGVIDVENELEIGLVEEV
jgi:uncharacterized protein YrrD